MSQKPNTTADMDSQMLGGCSVFVASSLITYGLAVWPFFVMQPLWESHPLLTATGLAAAGTTIFTLIIGKRAVMAGGFGNLAGVASAGVFVYLTLNHVVPLDAMQKQTITQWDPSVGYIIPILWFVLTLLIVLVQLMRSKA